ncbi:MAG: GumC family protein [bacterium]
MEPFFINEDEQFDDEKLDLQKYFRVLIKRWWLISIITLVVLVPWVLHLKSQPPVYEAEALIRFKSFAGSDPSSLMKSRITELTSRSFAEKVVAQLGLSMHLNSQNKRLTKRNEFFDVFSTSKKPVSGDYILRLSSDQTYTLTFKLSDKEIGRIIQKGSISEITKNVCTVNGFSFKLVPNGLELPLEIPFKIGNFRKTVEAFISRTKVKPSRSGTLMKVTLTDTDPYLVTEMTNRLAEIFIEESASLKKKSIQSKRQILEEQLHLVEQKLDESDKALKNFKEQYSTNLDADQKNQLNDLLGTEKRKKYIETVISTLNALLAKLKEKNETIIGDGVDQSEINRRYVMREIASHSVFDDNATMLISRQRLRDLEASWKEQVARTSEENFRAKEILHEIKQLHYQIENIAIQEIQKLEKDLVVTNQEIAKLEYRLKQLPTYQYQLSELTRKHQVLENQYMDLLAKTREAVISEAVETENIEILDPAIIPELPTNRDKKKKAAYGGIFGLMLGVTVALVLEFLDKSIKTADDVKKYLKLKILGSIPQIDFNDVYDFQDSEKIKQIDQQLVTHDYSPSPVGEAYRSLRTNLMFSKETGRIQSLVITSNEPGDGKSFTAANLSITFAQLKSNTLLIDSDLRRGVLHNTFGVSKEPGLSNYLTNMVPLQSILNETHIPNLTLISCGSLIPNPSELLGSHQMQRFLDEVRRKFELIIFDSPPLNAATDAVVIGTQVDSTVIVIRAGKTDREVAQQKLELFSNMPSTVIGVILNGTTADMAHPGYSYYHY